MISFCEYKELSMNATLLRFPANEQISGASKIPTVIFYDPQGNVRAVGAEAMREGILEDARDGDWVKAEWYVPTLYFASSLFTCKSGSNCTSAPNPKKRNTREL